MPLVTVQMPSLNAGAIVQVIYEYSGGLQDWFYLRHQCPFALHCDPINSGEPDGGDKALDPTQPDAG